MRGPSVILAKQNAAAIAQRRPNALVLDHERFRIWRGEHCVVIGSCGQRTRLFTLIASYLCAADGCVSHDAVFEALYGDDIEGGPDDPMKMFYVLNRWARDALLWSGLSVRSRHGYHDFECRWLPLEAPTCSLQVRTDGQSRRIPTEISAPRFLQAAE